jgi:hypothetical protein
VVACQQLRTHETFDSDFYLHVTSKGIIEDCDRVRFAAYAFCYDGCDDDMAASGLGATNNWDKVPIEKNRHFRPKSFRTNV